MVAVLGGNTVVSALLLYASCSKLLAPTLLRESLNELFRKPAFASNHMVRAIAIVEAAVALALMAPSTRSVAAAAGLVIGAALILLGVLGRVLGARSPCGCLGPVSTRPLGWLNVEFGLLIALGSSLNWVRVSVNNHRYAEWLPATTALVLYLGVLILRWSLLRSEPSAVLARSRRRRAGFVP